MWMIGSGAEKRIRCLKKGGVRSLVVYLGAELVFFTHGLFSSPEPGCRRVYVNLWHGDGPKRTENRAFRIRVKSTYVVSGTKLWGDYKADFFGLKPAAALVVGNPRIDQFDRPASDNDLLSLGLDPARKIVFWLPTYREVRQARGMRYWKDGGKLSARDEIRAVVLHLAAASERRGIQVLLKPHPLEADLYGETGIRCLNDTELNQRRIPLYSLLARSCALITDYSSVWTDYFPLDRPMAFYCPDLEEYSHVRGFNVPDLTQVMPGRRLLGASDIDAFLDLIQRGEDPDRAMRHAIARSIGAVTNTGATRRLIEKVFASPVLERSLAMNSFEKRRSEEGKLAIAVVWSQYGPYHFARMREFQHRASQWEVRAVEIGSKSKTYEWKRGDKDGDLTTLFRGKSAEEISAVDIYLAACSMFAERGIKIVFVPSYWPLSSLSIIFAARTVGAGLVMMNESHALTAKARGIWAEVKRRLVLQFDSALVGGTPHRSYFQNLGMKPERIVTGYDAIDNRYFAPRVEAVRTAEGRKRVRAMRGLPERYYLNVGRMVWKKNLETLIDAYVRVKERLGEDCPALVLVGSGKLERALQERCLEHGLSLLHLVPATVRHRNCAADVYFLGFRQVEELPDFYALAECFILPSREEEWGLVVNEAMACGLPVLVSNVAGCARDLVRHGENGFLFDPFDAATLAKHMEVIARDSELKARMGAMSERIIADWGCERFATAACQAAEVALDQIKRSASGGWQNGVCRISRTSVLTRITALAVLVTLDAHQKVRRASSRTFLRVMTGVLAVGLVSIILSSLFALRQIATSVDSLIGDSMTGLESSVTMRSAVRETQLDLLRLRFASGKGLSSTEVKEFEKKITTLLRDYQENIYDSRDQINVRRIERRLTEYTAALAHVTEQTGGDAMAIKAADEAARSLIEAVELAYQFNLERVHQSANDARIAARQALHIFNRLLWSFVLFTVFVLLIYVAYRLLALPDAGID